MAPAREEPTPSWPLDWDKRRDPHKGKPRNLEPIEALKFDDILQPKQYEIYGTHPDSKILFTDVNILDGSGSTPYKGDVLIEGKRQFSSASQRSECWRR